MTEDDRVLSFLQNGDECQEKRPAGLRLKWAQDQLAVILNTLEVERMNYRVASAVNDEREKKVICQRVEALLFRQDEWERIIAEIEAEA